MLAELVVEHSQEWNFTSQLALRLTIDHGPALAGGTKVGAPGYQLDFFGKPRKAAVRADGRVAQAVSADNTHPLHACIRQSSFASSNLGVIVYLSCQGAV